MRHRLSKTALGLVIAPWAAPVAHAEPADTIVTDDSATIVSCRECDTLAAYAAKLAAANPPAEPKTFADLVAIERQKALTGQDDGKTLGELAKEWEDSHPALPPATFADSIAFERQQVMEGKSSGDETLADLQAKWDATHGGGNSPTDPDAPPVDTGSGRHSSWSGTTDGSQPAGGWFSGGGYAADGFKQIDSRTSDGTTIQSWVSPDGMTTV